MGPGLWAPGSEVLENLWWGLISAGASLQAQELQPQLGWLFPFSGTLLLPRTGINTGSGVLLAAALPVSPHWTELRII